MIVVGLLVAIGYTLVSAAGDATPTGAADATRNPAAPVVVPTGGTADGAIAVGSATATVTVDVYLDYLCPFCGRFDKANAADLERLVADGTARVVLHPMAFLDKASAGTRYSTRAANAVATVADAAPDRVLAFTRALFEHQPAEGRPGLTDDEIADIAARAGVPGAVTDRFRLGTFEPWVAAGTAAAFDAGVTGTPTVRIGGRAFTGDLYTAGPLAAAVRAAAGR